MSENVVPESNEPEMAFDDAMRSQLMNLAYHYLDQYFDERARCALGFGGPHEWREQDCLWAQFREIEDALSSGERIEEFAFCIDELWEYLSAECWERRPTASLNRHGTRCRWRRMSTTAWWSTSREMICPRCLFAPSARELEINASNMDEAANVA